MILLTFFILLFNWNQKSYYVTKKQGKKTKYLNFKRERIELNFKRESCTFPDQEVPERAGL